MDRARGFTLIELMIVVVMIGVLASLALPNLLAARLAANESTAIATLRAISAAQSQFQKGARADSDADGFGEYGTLGEMTAAQNVRATSRPIQTAVLSSAFRWINPTGEAGRFGYLFRVYLPDSAGRGLGEVPGGGAPVGIDSNLSETYWCIYAWPINYLQSGRRTFFLSHDGEITFAESSSYAGVGNGPDPGAANMSPGPSDSITGPLATGVTGRDGLIWRGAGG